MQGDIYAITTQLSYSLHHNHLIVLLLFIRDEQQDAADMIEQVRRRKLTYAGHVSKIRDNRWTLRIPNLDILRKENT